MRGHEIVFIYDEIMTDGGLTNPPLESVIVFQMSSVGSE